MWNCIIAVITPYMVGEDKGNLGAKVFFIWGSLCAVCFVYAYFLVPETKGLTLEQVDRMFEEGRGRIQSEILVALTRDANAVGEVDFDAAATLIEQRLPPAK